MAEDAPIGETDFADISRIVKMIPHRYPMLMIDRVVDMVRDRSATGIKNVSVNEPQFRGHFPNHPVMPGVMIVESMAQTAAVLVVHTLGPAAEGKLVYFMSIDGARFRRPVVPGDAMHVHVTKVRNRGPVWKFRAVAKVDGNVVAEAEFAAMIREDDGASLA
ncbi:MAG: 3-hydroxyacyl-ACP dehydratase FabZ [Proteobacteria bacterium]|nr:3-hydroxyacyl-ACP dehydratase FabZ [Pseudomonadota bacterium]MDA1058579.1 3-hydroxyacyl-ACP dehydratase FabZ [Pseudomonadota bacterium]